MREQSTGRPPGKTNSRVTSHNTPHSERDKNSAAAAKKQKKRSTIARHTTPRERDTARSASECKHRHESRSHRSRPSPQASQTTARKATRQPGKAARKPGSQEQAPSERGGTPNTTTPKTRRSADLHPDHKRGHEGQSRAGKAERSRHHRGAGAQPRHSPANAKQPAAQHERHVQLGRRTRGGKYRGDQRQGGDVGGEVEARATARRGRVVVHGIRVLNDTGTYSFRIALVSRQTDSLPHTTGLPRCLWGFRTSRRGATPRWNRPPLP